MMTGEDLGPCPFCNGQIAFSKDAKGQPNGMIHSMPMCKEFETKSALEFATAVRKVMTGRGWKS